MTSSPIAAEIHEPFNIHGYFTSPVTLDNIFVFNNGPNSVDIVSTQIIAVHLIRKIRLIENLASRR